jgi:starch synthase
MRILLASSEVYPFSKTGGLGDMLGAMAKSLAAAGAEVAVFTPLYRCAIRRCRNLQRLDWRFDLPLGTRHVQARLAVLPQQPRLRIYFLDQPAFFDRAELYQEGGGDYGDNAERFIFLSKCTAHFARYHDFRPQLVHVHDWQVALVPLLIRHQALREGWSSPPHACLTIHNLAYQGVFGRGAYDLTNLPRDYFHPEGAEFYGALNCLKAGIVWADWITTVSPRYAREILTEPYGCNLDGVLRKRISVLTGILNGVDYSEWRTRSNPYLVHSFSARRLQGKIREKVHLQSQLGLPANPSLPLFGNISRLVDQKGTDLLLAALEEMCTAPLQVALLGSGLPAFESAYRQLTRRHPQKVAVRLGYDHALAHRIEAASDFYLMPSRFEPCGLNQMYSLRYGSIPIVRATGGLDDSVVDPNESLEHATGIKFYEPSARALAKAIRKSLVLYQDPDLLRHFRLNAMAADFSWKRTAVQYLDLYRRLLRQRA